MTQFEPQFPAYVDNTMVSAYKTCAYKFSTIHLRGIQSPEPNHHLNFGGVFAGALEVARIAFFVNGLTAEESISAGGEYILQNFGDWDDDFVGAKNLRNCIWAFENYLRFAYPLDEDRFVPYRRTAAGRHMIEYSFAVPLLVNHPVTDEPLIYTGRCDMISADRQVAENIWDAPEVWIQDEKTTGQMGGTWANQWRLRGQFMGYVWAARQEDIPAVGALTRGVCVYKRNEPKFEQAFNKFSPVIIDRWYEQLIATLEQMVADWKRGYWKQDFGESCSVYGGCHLLSMCELENPEPFFAAKFVERRWDPLNRVEVGEEQ